MTAPVLLYLDHMASTPLAPEVRAAMLAWLDPAAVGNPHSEHAAGWRAAKAVEQARAAVAALIGAKPAEIVFTSGATEANNLALFGLAESRGRLIVSAIEHPSVLAPAAALAARGLAVKVLPVDGEGRVAPEALERALRAGPALVSIMAANNEIGTLQPLAEIARLCRAAGALLHSDAVQALSTRALDVAALPLDLLSLSGHKLYGPMGIGALYLRGGLDPRPTAVGGGQEKGRRSGTLPVAQIVGLGVACDLARERREADAARLAALRERLFAGLLARFPALRRNSPADGLAGCLNVTLPGVDAADLLLDIPELAASTGSACSAESGEPSPVLRAIGLDAEAAHASLRFGLGRGTTEAEIDRALALLSAAPTAKARRAAS